MAKTPSTSANGYCTPAQSLFFVDPIRLGDLVRYDDSTASPTELLSDENWAVQLLASSGELESACMAGEKYLPPDLEALADGGGSGAAHLAKIVARHAFGEMRRNKGIIEDDEMGYMKDAKAYLDQLREGKRIFALVETRRAGLPGVTEPTFRERFDAGDPTAVWHRNFGGRLADRRRGTGARGGYWNCGC